MTYKLDDKVYYPADAAPFIVVGIRKDQIEIEGDFSGGTHNVCQRGWVNINEVKPFDYSKMKVYPPAVPPYKEEEKKHDSEK